MEMATGLDRWWSYLLRGILAIIFGIILLVWPKATVLVLIVFFGCYVLVEGLITVGFAIARASKSEKFFGLLMLGLLGIIIGVITLARPGITALAILMVIAIWLVIRGFLMVVSAFEISGSAGVKWILGLTGAAALILGILLLVFPISGAFGIVLVTGIYLIVTGLFTALASFFVKDLEGMGPDNLAAA